MGSHCDACPPSDRQNESSVGRRESAGVQAVRADVGYPTLGGTRGPEGSSLVPEPVGRTADNVYYVSSCRHGSRVETDTHTPRS